MVLTQKQQDDIDALAKVVNERTNLYTGTKGYLLRTDVDNALIIYNDNTKKTENVADFMTHLTFLSELEKVKTINDAQSYLDV